MNNKEFSYNDWADQYERDAAAITPILTRLNEERRRTRLSADERKQLDSKIHEYREIRRGLIDIAVKLRGYGRRYER